MFSKVIEIPIKEYINLLVLKEEFRIDGDRDWFIGIPFPECNYNKEKYIKTFREKLNKKFGVEQ